MMQNQNEEQISVNEGLLLTQKKDGLKFGTDSLLLSAFLGQHGENSYGIELGSGTGILSLLALRRGKLGRITALEVQPEYASLTARNAEQNGLTDRLEVVCTDLRDYPRNEQADYVFTNPPYMKVDCGKANQTEAKFIARHEVCGSISEFCRCGAGMLKYGGSFYVVYRPERLCDLLVAMREARLEPKRLVFVSQTPFHPPSLVLVEGKKGGASGCIIPQIFYLKNEDGTDSEFLAEVLTKGTMYGR